MCVAEDFVHCAIDDVAHRHKVLRFFSRSFMIYIFKTEFLNNLRGAGMKYILKFFSSPPRWEEYKNFYQLAIFRYLVMWFSIVPLFAGLLSGLPDPLPINVAGNDYLLRMELPFNWKILWLSSFLFLISFALYLYKCPSFIRKYNQFSEYIAYCHDKRWMAWLVKELFESNVDREKFLSRILEKGYAKDVTGAVSVPSQNPKVGSKQTVVYLKINDRVYEAGFPVLTSHEAADEAERGVFWEIFGRYSNSSLGCRILIRILLFFSALLFLFVLVQNIYAGLVYLMPYLESVIGFCKGLIP